MANALQTFFPSYFNPLWNICLIDQPVLNKEQHVYGRCGRGAPKNSCGHCCSFDGYCTTDPKYCGAPTCLYPADFTCYAANWPPGFDTSSTPRPKIGDVPYGKTFRSCTVKGTMALTFDDGPGIWTPDLLDILKANDVKATFFIRALNLYEDLTNKTDAGFPATLKRTYAEGHQIASHTWSHRNMDRQLSSPERKEEMIKAEIALTSVLGFFPTYMRPPFDACVTECEADMGDMGYHVTSFDIDPLDWAGNYTHARETFIRRLTTSSRWHRGWLPLAHDTLKDTVHGYTQFMIDESRARGYKFVKVGECMDDPEENWYRHPVTGEALASGVANSSEATEYR